MGKWVMPFVLVFGFEITACVAEKKIAGKNDIQGRYNSNPLTRDARNDGNFI